MQGFLLNAAAVLMLPVSALAGTLTGNSPAKSTPEGDNDHRLDSVVVSSTRAGKSTPVTYTMVGKNELQNSNPINSLPMILALQPSVVTTNEGGTGLGYSKMTVRGVQGSQINVTLNGITLNDAESQEVFWVNIPALNTILSSVQVQRGLGTTANGAGAFGASLNMNTAFAPADPFVNVDVAAGSYGTMMTSVAAGSGIMPSGLYVSGAYSRNFTDGYIRNAKANVQSGLAVLGWLKGNNSLRLTYIFGDQCTGLTWSGIPLSLYKTDRKYNGEGEYYDQFGNVRYYDNQTDNYTQHHLQFNYTRQFSGGWAWSTTFNFTKGDGYYENYTSQEKFKEYGFNEIYNLDGVEYKTGDFIIHKSMDNDYEVLNSDLRYNGNKLRFTGGINLSRYHGGHFGEVLWSDVLEQALKDGYKGHEWYRNNSYKREMNVYARAEYQPIEWLTAYADLQYRLVALKMVGPDDNFKPLDYRHTWNFFNPRAGLTFSWSPLHKAYASVALGHREPGRADLKESIEYVYGTGGNMDKDMKLKAETMTDIEFGYQYSGHKVSAGANFYFMEYRNMLVQTGRLSDVGYKIRDNVDRSYRRGVELYAAWTPNPIVRLDANATLSLNKIKNYTHYMNEYEDFESWNLLPQSAHPLGTTNILMSPSVIGMAQVAVAPFSTISSCSLKTTTLTINGKFVGKQYWDNTSSSDRCIPSYFVSNLSLTHEFNLGKGKLGLGAYINNLLNNKYYADVWVYRAHAQNGEYYQEEGLYPQALRNFMFKVSYRF